MTTEERVDKLFRIVLEGNGEKPLTERMAIMEQTANQTNLMLAGLATTQKDMGTKLDTLLRRSTTWNKAEFWKTARWFIMAVLTLAAVLISLAVYWREVHPHESLMSTRNPIVAQYNSEVAPH